MQFDFLYLGVNQYIAINILVPADESIHKDFLIFVQIDLIVIPEK